MCLNFTSFSQMSRISAAKGEQLKPESVQLLQRLLYHPDNVVQLLVARILEYVPRETAWKKVLDDRQVAFAAVMQCGLALEFVIDSFQEA